jgi:hypothetical protein
MKMKYEVCETKMEEKLWETKMKEMLWSEAMPETKIEEMKLANEIIMCRVLGF